MAGLFSSQDKSLSSNRVSAEILKSKSGEHFSCSDHWESPCLWGFQKRRFINRGERWDSFQVLLSTLLSLKQLFLFREVKDCSLRCRVVDLSIIWTPSHLTLL